MMSHEFLQLELRAGEQKNGMNFRGSEKKLWTPATCLHSHPAWGKRPPCNLRDLDLTISIWKKTRESGRFPRITSSITANHRLSGISSNYWGGMRRGSALG